MSRPISQLSRRRQIVSPTRLARVNRQRRWVVQLWEAFLLQVDDFDRLLELQLRRKLDALVAAPAPVRRGRARPGSPSKAQRSRESTQKIGTTESGASLVFVEQS